LPRLLGLDVGQTAYIGTASFESSRALGDIWALTQLWEGLGLHRLGAAFRQSSRHRVDLEALLRVMVFNRLCDADSKLGVLRWLQTVSANLSNGHVCTAFAWTRAVKVCCRNGCSKTAQS
jgi:hypothetical protein